MQRSATITIAAVRPHKKKEKVDEAADSPVCNIPTSAIPSGGGVDPRRLPGREPSTNASSRTYLLFIATCIFVSMTGIFLHHYVDEPHNVHRHAMMRFERDHLGGKQKVAHEEKREERRAKAAAAKGVIREGAATENSSPGRLKKGAVNTEGGVKPPTQPLHDLAGLSCADHGGPTDGLASEMVYWRDIPSDAVFKSPIGSGMEGRKYLTFEPDGGGFNNARMSMETMVVMSHAMGRTLVLPPSQGMYRLRKDRDKQRVHFSLEDFYHMEQVGFEHDGLDIISTEEFLRLEAMAGNLRNRTTGRVSFPPNNRTNWDGMDPKPLKEWLRDVALTPMDWHPDWCLAAFPSDDGSGHFEELEAVFEEARRDLPSWEQFKDKPMAVDAAPVDRMREAMVGGVGQMCVYDKEMQDAPVVHFMCYHKMRVRMLTHFYAFLFFEDWWQDLWSKRFVRDHLRYSDEIQCAAARVVAAVRKRARGNDPAGNPGGHFDSFHIRRGDFQYKNTRLEADQIYKNVKQDIPEKTTVFVATDHKGRPFFRPLAAHYDLVFLGDFKNELEGVNTNFFGMIDQLVASRGRTFFGCFHSTFSGFIFRMRGYHSQKEKADGWENGTLQRSYYYTGARERGNYKHYMPVHGAVYSREFPTSWRDIDKGINGPLDVGAVAH